jgi:hypothetical protein
MAEGERILPFSGSLEQPHCTGSFVCLSPQNLFFAPAPLAQALQRVCDDF